MFMQRFVRAWDLIVDMIMVLAGILLWGQMIIVNIEVVARYFGKPTTWATEISSLMVLWIPFMVVAWVLRNEGHVKMDLIVEHISPASRAMIDFITSLIGIVVMLIVAVAGLLTTLDWVGTKTPTILMLPKAPAISIICVGSFMFAVQLFIRTLTNLNKWKTLKSKGKVTSGEVPSTS